MIISRDQTETAIAARGHPGSGLLGIFECVPGAVANVDTAVRQVPIGFNHNTGQGEAGVNTRNEEPLRAALARTGKAADFDDLRDKIMAAQDSVRSIYARLIDEPAEAL